MYDSKRAYSLYIILVRKYHEDLFTVSVSWKIKGSVNSIEVCVTFGCFGKGCICSVFAIFLHMCVPICDLMSFAILNDSSLSTQWYNVMQMDMIKATPVDTCVMRALFSPFDIWYSVATDSSPRLKTDSASRMLCSRFLYTLMKQRYARIVDDVTAMASKLIDGLLEILREKMRMKRILVKSRSPVQ